MGQCCEVDEDKLTGSEIPALGHTISKDPYWKMAASNASRSCFQSVTSDFWKDTSPLFSWTNFSASAVKRRSTMRTLHDLDTRRFAKARPIPEPAPVIRATLPETWSAMLSSVVCNLLKFVCVKEDYE